jgi:hypothetical protein
MFPGLKELNTPFYTVSPAGVPAALTQGKVQLILQDAFDRVNSPYRSLSLARLRESGAKIGSDIGLPGEIAAAQCHSLSTGMPSCLDHLHPSLSISDKLLPLRCSPGLCSEGTRWVS